MPEYEESGSVDASPEVVFGYLSDVDNLTDYIPNMVLAREEGQRLRVAAEVQGRHEEGAAWFRPDTDLRRIEWGGQDRAGYGGWLEVTAAGQGSAVTIHLSTDRVSDAEEIRGFLSQALVNIRDRVESS
jgi:carbon monoxide dehydrogenase subunit G